MAWNLLRRMADARDGGDQHRLAHLMQHGVPGRAYLIGLQQTGLRVNHEPQLRLSLVVQTRQHGTYNATVEEVVPMMYMCLVNTGHPLPVLVDPRNPRLVGILWQGLATSTVHLPPDVREAQQRYLLATGVPGRMRVGHATATGTRDAQGWPVYDFVVTLEVPGQAPLTGPLRIAVDPAKEPFLRPGASIPVRIDAHDPMAMAADWDALSPDSAAR